MKLITNTQITVDGVMQANGGNNPDARPRIRPRRLGAAAGR